MNKKGVIFIFVITFFIIYAPNVNSDVISINSGGGSEVIINPGADIEGFFSGGAATCSPTTCSVLGYDCGSWDNGCGGTLSCGSCASGYTCDSGVCTVTPTTPENPSGGEVTPSLSIEVNPTEINLPNMVIGEAERVVIEITNHLSTSQTLSINQVSLSQVIILGMSSITLAPGETKELTVTFVSLDPGNFAGTIIIGGVRVLVNLNVRTERFLFDSNIIVLNKDYKVPSGSPLRTRVGLVPQGIDNERMDVTLNYAIKDFSGKVYLTQKETVLVTSRMDFDRNFQTGMLPVGDYVISLELVYPGGVAPSSAHFAVTPRNVERTLASIILFLITGIVVLSIFIVIVLIRIKRHR